MKADQIVLASILGTLCWLGGGMTTVAAQECSGQLQQPQVSAAARFSVNTNGTVIDRQSGLMWKQCLEGQRGTGCVGVATPLSWEGADNSAVKANRGRFAGYSDWRLPNVDELRGIVEPQCREPAVNLRVFPNTPAQSLWAANRVGQNAWSVDFAVGLPLLSINVGTKYVRLVRDLR